MAKSNRATKARKGRWGITVRLEVEHAKMLATAAEGARRTQRAELARILDLHFTAVRPVEPLEFRASESPSLSVADQFRIRAHLIDTGLRPRRPGDLTPWVKFEGHPFEIWSSSKATLTLGREYVAVIQPVKFGVAGTLEHWLVSAEAVAEPNAEG